MTQRTVYLINLSFGLAGTERRFANIWRTLQKRGRVRPVLVVPDTLAEILERASLISRADPDLWTVPEPSWSRAIGRVPVPHFAEILPPFLRSRVVAARYGPVWDRIAGDPDAVIHVGLNCSALEPSDQPIVYECVDSLLTQLGTRHYIKAAERPSIIHCQTERIRKSLEAVHVNRHPRWVTVSSPCYFATYADPIPGIQRDPMLVGFVGRMAPEKNPLLFVDALAVVRRKGIPVRAFMLGAGPLREAVEQRLREHGLTDYVEVGFSDRPMQRLQEAAIYVSLQVGDNYGSQSLLEAMGAGCAIVASDVGETARVVDDSVGKRVSFDVADLSRALEDLLGAPDSTLAKGASAARRVRTDYTADAYCAFLESLYERAVERYSAAQRLPARSS